MPKEQFEIQLILYRFSRGPRIPHSAKVEGDLGGLVALMVTGNRWQVTGIQVTGNR